MEKFKSLLMIAALFYVFCLSSLLSEAKVTEWVQRRPSHDIYSFINLSHQTCESNTFLIEENQCVQDQELYEGCSDSVVPDLSLDLVAFVYLHLNPSNVAYFLVENENTNGRFYFNGTNQSVDGSHCQIDSLEVYRGRRQAIEISHDGFSLTENGTVQINKAQLAYSLNEYGGELYRLNVSCSTETQPRRGCLFFKVRGQQLENYVTNAKFNCTVPGTVSDFFDECNKTKTKPNPVISTKTVLMATTSTILSVLATGSIFAIPSIIHIAESYNYSSVINSFEFKVGSIPFYVTTVLGGILVIIILSLVGCTLLVILVKKKKRERGTVTIALKQVSSPHDDSDTQVQDQQQPQKPMYDSIDNFDQRLDNDRGDRVIVVSISPNRCSKNPAYVHLSPEEEDSVPSLIPTRRTCKEGALAVSISQSQCTKNPAYIDLPPQRDTSEVSRAAPNESRSATVSVSPSRSFTMSGYVNVSQDTEERSQLEAVATNKYHQHLAFIHLKIGEENSQGVIISISKHSQNYRSMVQTNSSHIANDERVGNETNINLNTEEENPNTLLLSFSKWNENDILDVNKIPEDSPSSSDHRPARFCVDLENEIPQTIVISTGNTACSQMSVCHTNRDPLGDSHVSQKSHGDYDQNPTYVNLNPEYESP